RLSRLCISSFVLRRPPISTLFPYTTLFRSIVLISLRYQPPIWAPVLPRGKLTMPRGANSSRISLRPSPSYIQAFIWRTFRPKGRSEEHTSELQSRENLVCRLLLEKKKKNKK